jgi:hypothetical protein
MPLLQYFVGVGSVLLCLIFAFDAWLPKQPVRESADIDRTTIRVTPRGPEFAVRLAPDEDARPFVPSSASPVRDAFAKLEQEAKKPLRPKRVVPLSPQTDSPYNRPPQQVAASPGYDGSNASSQNGWSRNWPNGWTYNNSYNNNYSNNYNSHYSNNHYSNNSYSSNNWSGGWSNQGYRGWR